MHGLLPDHSPAALILDMFSEFEFPDGATLQTALTTPGPVLVEALVDPNEPLLPPKRMPKYVENMEKALAEGTHGAAQIRAALDREPSRSQLRS